MTTDCRLGSDTVKQHGRFGRGLRECLSVETVLSDRVLKVDGHNNWGARHFVLFWIQVVKLGRVKMRFCIPASSQISRRFWWSRCLRLKSAAARLLGLRVRIPPGARMSVSCECCVLSCRGLCVGPITRPEDTTMYGVSSVVLKCR